MSPWKSPCRDCTRRAPGCHNVETCEDWREWVKARDAWRAHKKKEVDYRNASVESLLRHEKRRR